MKNDIIVSDFAVMRGKPIIKGTRITAESLLRKLSEGANFEDIKAMYPHITDEHLFAILAYAADTLANEEMILSS